MGKKRDVTFPDVWIVVFVYAEAAAGVLDEKEEHSNLGIFEARLDVSHYFIGDEVTPFGPSLQGEFCLPAHGTVMVSVKLAPFRSEDQRWQCSLAAVNDRPWRRSLVPRFA